MKSCNICIEHLLPTVEYRVVEQQSQNNIITVQEQRMRFYHLLIITTISNTACRSQLAGTSYPSLCVCIHVILLCRTTIQVTRLNARQPRSCYPILESNQSHALPHLISSYFHVFGATCKNEMSVSAFESNVHLEQYGLHL